jgi:hypothetical protein
MRTIFLIFFLATTLVVAGQKRLSEGSMTFSVINLKAGKPEGDTLSSIHYFKGAHLRTDLIGKLGNAVTIYDTRETKGAIIRDFGSQKILIPLDETAWQDRNSWFANSVIEYLPQEQLLLGYPCKMAKLTMVNGAAIEVMYTSEVKLENTNTEFQFGDLPGLVLAYTYTKGDMTVIYKPISLNFDPVPIQKFDIPNSGYRLLDYKESKK